MFLWYALLCERVVDYQNFNKNPDFKILTTLGAISAHHGRNYCFPSQDTLLARLTRSGRQMCRRTLNRHLNALVRDGYVKRIRRHQRCPERGMIFRSTLYTLTRKALRWLAALQTAVGQAFKFASNFSSKSRVTNLSQHRFTKPNRIGDGPPRGGGPIPENDKNVAGGSAADDWDKKQARLADFRRTTGV